MNWNYSDAARNTSDDYSCIDGWYCTALNANNTHKCAMIDVNIYNVRECDNYTIDSYQISYLKEIECCQTDFCNRNYSSSQWYVL